MRQKCVCCVVRSAPASHFVMSVRSTIVLNVLTPTLVGAMLFVKYNRAHSKSWKQMWTEGSKNTTGKATHAYTEVKALQNFTCP